MSKDAYDTCVLVRLLGNIVAGAMEEMSIDVVIESLSAVLGGAICQKHEIEVREPLAVSKQIAEAADKLIMDNKKPLVPDPSNNTPIPVVSLVTDYHNKTNEYPDISPSNSLLGKTVIPHDGSYSLTIINGVMKHQFIACDDLRKQWKVVAVNGRFPTQYHHRGDNNYILHDDKYNVTNDIMMVALYNPNEVTFANSRFVKEV